MRIIVGCMYVCEGSDEERCKEKCEGQQRRCADSATSNCCLRG